MKKVFLLTIEDWNEDSPDDNAWIEFITTSLDGGSIDVKCEVYNAAQPAFGLDAPQAAIESEKSGAAHQ